MLSVTRNSRKDEGLGTDYRSDCSILRLCGGGAYCPEVKGSLFHCAGHCNPAPGRLLERHSAPLGDRGCQVTGFGNVIAGILIVSLGTTIDFPELRRQWKVVVTALVCVVGATLAIILIGYPLIGKEMALSVAPIFAGGSAATLIMTTALD